MNLESKLCGSDVWHVFLSRMYKETERDKFAVLESKARSDKNVMMSRVLHSAYIGVSESLCDAMVESSASSLLQLPGLVILSYCQFTFHLIVKFLYCYCCGCSLQNSYKARFKCCYCQYIKR